MIETRLHTDERVSNLINWLELDVGVNTDDDYDFGHDDRSMIAIVIVLCTFGIVEASARQCVSSMEQHESFG